MKTIYKVLNQAKLKPEIPSKPNHKPSMIPFANPSPYLPTASLQSSSSESPTISEKPSKFSNFTVSNVSSKLTIKPTLSPTTSYEPNNYLKNKFGIKAGITGSTMPADIPTTPGASIKTDATTELSTTVALSALTQHPSGKLSQDSPMKPSTKPSFSPSQKPSNKPSQKTSTIPSTKPSFKPLLSNNVELLLASPLPPSVLKIDSHPDPLITVDNFNEISYVYTELPNTVTYASESFELSTEQDIVNVAFSACPTDFPFTKPKQESTLNTTNFTAGNSYNINGSVAESSSSEVCSVGFTSATSDHVTQKNLTVHHNYELVIKAGHTIGDIQLIINSVESLFGGYVVGEVFNCTTSNSISQGLLLGAKVYTNTATSNAGSSSGYNTSESYANSSSGTLTSKYSLLPRDEATFTENCTQIDMEEYDSNCIVINSSSTIYYSFDLSVITKQNIKESIRQVFFPPLL